LINFWGLFEIVHDRNAAIFIKREFLSLSHNTKVLKMENKTCENCGKEYMPTKRNQKFCSVLCYQLNIQKQIKKLREIEMVENEHSIS